VTERKNPSGHSRAVPPSSWDLNRLCSLLKANLQEIEKEHPLFFGSLKIEINFRDGEIETVAVDHRQTFKD
jgi:hypothetical protein